MSCHRIIIKGGRKVCLPVKSREEYLKLRGSKENTANRIKAGKGDEEAKRKLVQMNYSCLPNDDGTLKGTTRMSTTVGMDIDHLSADSLEQTKQLILSKKDELGLLMLERSARGAGFHLVFRRRAELSQEDNLRWASNLLGVEYDKGAKDITRVFFTTTASEEDLIFLEDELFETPLLLPRGGENKQEGINQSAQSNQSSQRPQRPQSSQSSQKVSPRGDLEGVGAVAGACFLGIPYSVIINGLLSRFGFAGGNVPEGARNSTLYRLARQLRYICDFNTAYIQSVVPSWGLGEEEVRQTILSAVNSTRATEMPYELKSVLNDIQKPDLSTQQKRQEYLDRLNPLPKKMPWLLRYIYKRYGRNGRSALVAALPMLGTLLGRFESKYLDGRRHKPVFMAVVCGHAGSGKGFIADMQEWLLKPVLEADAVGRQQLEAYAREREKKKGAKQLPDKPTPCMRVLSATSSNGMLLERAKAALGQPLCVITEEIDESSRANRNGAWADKSDIYRKAFDGAIWGQDYLTYSGSVRIFVNLVFAGTYTSVRNYFSNVENGLMTRFFFTEMARDLGCNVEVKWDKETKEDKRANELVQSLYEQGSTTEIPAEENAIEFQLPQAKRNAYKFNDEKIAEWQASGPDDEHRDNAIDLLRRRAAVFIFRASQIMYALEGMKETQVGNDMARWYGNECYLNQYIMFADALNDVSRANEAIQRKQDLAASRVARTNALFKLLDLMPNEFTADDLKRQMQEKGMSPDSARTYLSRMVQRELVMKSQKGYKKIPL